MIVRLDKEQAKQERRKLLADDVYVIFSDVLGKFHNEGKLTLTKVEAFLTAKKFADLVLILPDIDEGIADELDDLEDEAGDGNDGMVIEMLAAALFYALGTHRVGFNSKSVIMKIYGRWNDHPLFFQMMDEASKKEQARWMEGKKIRLLTYELEQIDAEGGASEDVTKLFEAMLSYAEHMDKNSIKEQILFLCRYNLDHQHAYDNSLLALFEKLGIKSTTLLNPDKVIMYENVERQAIVNAGGVGFRNESK